jgi:tellurite resistance protein
MGSWLGAQPFSPAYWAYTFGVAAATITGLKLALAGIGAAKLLAMPVFIGANLFIGYLAVRTVYLLFTRQLLPPRPA